MRPGKEHERVIIPGRVPVSNATGGGAVGQFPVSPSSRRNGRKGDSCLISAGSRNGQVETFGHIPKSAFRI